MRRRTTIFGALTGLLAILFAVAVVTPVHAEPRHAPTIHGIDRETYLDRYDAYRIHTHGDPTIPPRLTYKGGHGIHREDVAAPDDDSDRSADEADDYDGDDN